MMAGAESAIEKDWTESSTRIEPQIEHSLAISADSGESKLQMDV